MIGRKLFLAATCCLMLVVTANAQSSKIDDLLKAETGKLVETYKMLHAAPELSGKEEKTSAYVAKELRALGYGVTERIGKYDQPGVVRAMA